MEGKRRVFFRKIIILPVSVALAWIPIVSAPCGAGSGEYSDIGDQPPVIQEAIGYSTEMGYLGGTDDGRFCPNDPLSRLDYASAMVKLFRNLHEEADPDVKFKDMKDTDPYYKYANLAVKHGYLSAYGDGTFRPFEPVTDAAALSGLVVGMQMDSPLRYLNELHPRGPSYGGHLCIAHDLHLKYRYTKAWPDDDYPRCEMAYSLMKVDQLEEWRIDYIRENFDWLHCQTPWTGRLRTRALDSAYEKIGCPYVWGGESDAEGGFDCSGLVYYVLSSVMGYPMLRVADDQARDGRYATLSRKELLAGDPIFFFDDAPSDASGYVGHAGMYIGQGMFIHSSGGNAGVSVDHLTGYWDEHFAWGKRVIIEPEPETFDTYILLCNPGDEKARARLTYMLHGGKEVKQEVEVEPLSRKTVKIDEMLFNQEVSTLVETLDGSLVAERAMYFRYLGKYPGGHDSAGVPAPACEWFMPEGCTAYDFDTYILLQNPGSVNANVTVEFYDPGGGIHSVERVLQPYSRCTVLVDNVKGMKAAEFSTRVVSDQPVVAERAMYFEYGKAVGGHGSPGATCASNDWYFAEGYTADQFDTYILLMNPGDRKADVELTLLGDRGECKKLKCELRPHSRRTVSVDGIKGWGNTEFSAMVHSEDEPIVAERAVYFDYNGVTDGHAALGSPGVSGKWYLAEGYTAGDFDTYVLLANFSDKPTGVKVRFMMSGGRWLDREYRIGAHSRYTIPVDRIEGLSDEEVSVYTESSSGIVVERAVYFKYGRIDGGTCAPGITGTSGKWFFAEGYTGK